MDHDIALHSIMVTNLDTEVDMETMKSRLDLIFHRVFSDGKVVSTKVIGKLDNLYNLALNLKQHKKFYRYYKRANWKLKKDGDKSRK